MLPSKMPGGPIQIALIYDKSSDALAKKVEACVRAVAGGVPLAKFRHFDYREPFIHSDINIHLGLPVYVACPWAFVNAIVKVDGVWNEAAHSAYMPAFDAHLSEADASSPSEALAGAVRHMVSLVGERRPKKGNFHCPPVLMPADCPRITVVTPTFQRGKLIDIAFHNLMATDYPQEKIEWIVVEDAEDSTQMVSDKIMSFQMNCPKIVVKYIPLSGRVSIGEKRNIGIEHATSDIIVFMDDDDHYPVTSLRRRVAWLLEGGKSIVGCTTIALYDLLRGVSAVNMPPMDLPLGARISEATLAFKKSAWVERKFGDKSLSEGEDWLTGRETEFLEILPQQIIVAFSHGGNRSGRRIPPADAGAGCFWGFPREYLLFIHKLAGVEVEEVGAGMVPSSSGKGGRT